MSLELMAEFDPFLAAHIEKFGNKGKGNVSYLSKTICEEFVQIMATAVGNKIIEEIKFSKIFCYNR